ncbi:MAG TPA: PAS domain S-box protein [Parafilimonas sp.]|nr:PAS domain S-box protein [Parafilimonas sp.]
MRSLDDTQQIETLKTEEDKYKWLFNTSPIPMYIYDSENFQFIAVNNAALKQYGYTKKEFLSLDATRIRPADDIPALKAANIAVPKSYFDFGYWRHIRKNLETFYVQIYGYATEFEGRKVTVVKAIDVDQKVKAEKALREKNAEITGILESITDGFYALNSKWEITYFNKTAERVLCCKRADVIGKNIWDYFPRSREGRFYDEYQRAMTEKISIHFEECYAPLGVWAAINVYPTPDGIAVYFVDITEQKKTQEKIYIDEQNLRAIINNTDDAIWSIDRNYQFISANTAFWQKLQERFGIGEGALTGEDFDKEIFKAWQEYYDRAFAGEAFKIVYTYEGADKTSYEEVRFNPIRNKQEEVIGISCFSSDITEQYLHLQKIEKQNEQLRKIAWMQSHELRLPVANILGLSTLFDLENRDEVSTKQILELMIKSTEQLDEVIRKITVLAEE